MNKTINIKILDKDYNINCPIEQEDNLKNAALLLDDKMREIKTKGNIIGVEKVAILAALNIANELIESKSALNDLDFNLEHKLSMLCAKVEKALS